MSQSKQPRHELDEETRDSLSRIPDQLFDAWGRSGVWAPFDGKYAEKTEVRSGQDARDAFETYTAYFERVLADWSPSSDTLVLLPCGSSKPIGSSTIHQKKVQAIRDGGLTDADIVVMSEPCTVVPPEYRLSLPAANYDFPPEYTEQDAYPAVFETFASRLATWLDAMDYDRIFPYLISGHMNKFNAALDRLETSPAVYRVPSASYNPTSESYAGDRFKKQEEMTMKVRGVRKHRVGATVELPDEYDSFYQTRFSD